MGWRFLSVLTLCVCANTAHGEPPQSAPADSQISFEDWRTAFKARAIEDGRSPAAAGAILDGAKYLPDVIHEDRHQYDVSVQLNKFFGDVATEPTLADGRTAYQRDRALFAAVADRYSVDAYPILGIWANESRYGRLIRPFPIASSLATLAYDKRRSAYFSNELMSLIRMQELGVPGLPQMTGSWAGALGQPQFEPSDYLQYAVDFDGDGRRDIWTNEGDVIASVANFLHRNGWQLGLAWGTEVSAPAALASDESLQRPPAANCKANNSLSMRMPISEWRKLSVEDKSNTADAAPVLPDATEASLLADRHLSGRQFLVTRNFEMILRYNCSLQYALTGGLVSDLVLKGN